MDILFLVIKEHTHTDFHSDSTCLYFHQQWISILFPQAFAVIYFHTTVILTRVMEFQESFDFYVAEG